MRATLERTVRSMSRCGPLLQKVSVLRRPSFNTRPILSGLRTVETPLRRQPQVVFAGGIVQNPLRDPLTTTSHALRTDQRNESAPIPAIIRQLGKHPDRARKATGLTMPVPLETLV